ncbi:MAG: phosphoglycerate kinase [Planctomycetota bacterium]
MADFTLQKLALQDLDVKGKRVLLRLDLDVPVDDRGNVIDDRRIRDGAPTIRAVIAKGGTPVVLGHLTRSKTRPIDHYRIDRVGKVLREMFGWNRVVTTIDAGGPASQAVVRFTTPGFIILLENLRFDPREEQNDPVFADWLARMGHCYVNDDFASLHLSHASIVGLPARFPGAAAAGPGVDDELRMFDRVFRAPIQPFVALLGGCDYFHLGERVELVDALLDRCQTIMVGGLLAYTFLAAGGHSIGGIWIDPEPIQRAVEVLNRAAAMNVRLMLPVDHVLVSDRSRHGTGSIAHGDIPFNWSAADIGPATAKSYAHVLRAAKTVFWHGPMGRAENERFAAGTHEVGAAIAASSALAYVCGNDTTQAARRLKLQGTNTHLARGAAVAGLLLQGKPIAGLDALTDHPRAELAAAR